MKYSNAKVSARLEGWATLETKLDSLETIAMEGAGVTGVVYTGALSALHNQGLLKSVKRFAGTSSGSIVATAAALGYRGKELEDIALEQNFKALCRPNPHWVKQILTRENFDREGVFSGGEIRRWVQTLCTRRIGLPQLNFQQLSNYRQRAKAHDIRFFRMAYREAMAAKPEARKLSRDKDFTYDFERKSEKESINAMIKIARGFRGLEIAVTELRDHKDGSRTEHGEIFSRKHRPCFAIADAVRASASYPYIFRLAKYRDKTGKIRTYTDGAFTIPLPLLQHDKNGKANLKTLGLVSEYFPDKPSEESIVPKLGGRTKQLMSMLATALGKKRINTLNLTDEDAKSLGYTILEETKQHFNEVSDAVKANNLFQKRIIPLDRDGVSGDDFLLNNEKKRQLIENAYETTLAVIENYKSKKATNSRINIHSSNNIGK